MAARTRASKLLDVSGVGLSCLCLLHCMALPLLVVSAPVLAVFSENEAIHQAFVILAAPVALLAVFSTPASRSKLVIIALILAGLGFLIAGAFIEAFHDYETLMTVIGAVLLSSGHIWRWRLMSALEAS